MSTRAPGRSAIRAISLIGVAVLTLAGCSGSDKVTSAAADEGGSTVPGAFSKADAQDALLTAESIGDGYTAIPASQLDAALSQGAGPLTEAIETMQVEPAECQSVVADAVSRIGDAAQQIDQSAVAVFVKNQDQGGQDMVSQLIAPASLLPAGDLGSQVQACSDMTLEISGLSATASMTPVGLDLGDESAAVITEMTLNAGGQEVTLVSAQSIVIQGEGALSIALSGAAANAGTLIEITTKAFEKAEPVLG